MEADQFGLVSAPTLVDLSVNGEPKSTVESAIAPGPGALETLPQSRIIKSGRHPAA